MAYFLLSAAHKSSGKTTLSIGLCGALRRQGLEVQPFKKGPDYIDPLWLGLAAQRPCHNLDFHTMERGEIQDLFARRMQGADVGLIEGNKGLYDGLELDGSNSNAALAALLSAPVVLVIDTRGMTRGIAPLILGYQTFDRDINIAGIVFNRVGGSRHEHKLRRVVEHYTDIPVIGAVHESRDLAIAERHLGLMPSNETSEAGSKIAAICEAVQAQVDLSSLLELAGTMPGLPGADLGRARAPRGRSIRVGVARDEAFGFYYRGDLEALGSSGAELVFFSPVSDGRLPDVEALFLGGGFPEVRMEELEDNRTMREEVRRFVESGGPVYAECGGLMYLARSITWKGKSCRMVGAIGADAVMCERPQGRGYVQLSETGAFPWPGLPGTRGPIPAHEFHYSRLENLATDVRYAYEVLRGMGIDGKHDGIVYKHLLANYCHMRDVRNNHWAQRFVDYVGSCVGKAPPDKTEVRV